MLTRTKKEKASGDPTMFDNDNLDDELNVQPGSDLPGSGKRRANELDGKTVTKTSLILLQV